jgi:hypothetical protein
MKTTKPNGGKTRRPPGGDRTTHNFYSFFVARCYIMVRTKEIAMTLQVDQEAGVEDSRIECWIALGNEVLHGHVNDNQSAISEVAARCLSVKVDGLSRVFHPAICFDTLAGAEIAIVSERFKQACRQRYLAQQ